MFEELKGSGCCKASGPFILFIRCFFVGIIAVNLKIAVIGGGSSYTPELIEGFIKRFAELPVKDLYLVDIEAGREKLEIIGKL